MKKTLNAKADKIRNKTYREMVDILNRDGRCAVIRPTGFGKTGLLTRLLKSKKYKSPLYIFPAEVVKNAVTRFYYENDLVDADAEIPGVEFMTNAKFARLEEDDIFGLGYEHDLVILDECHKIGGDKTSENLDKLLDLFPNLRVVGATATPDRMDAIDVIGRYFGTSVVSEYTIHDAFQDGILQKPYYVYCAFARPEENKDIITKEWKKELDSIDDKKEKLTLTEDLSNKTKEISDLYNMDKVIKRACDEYADTDYMKFIVFFPNFESLKKQKTRVKGWFRKAYKGHRIKELIITSETPETAENVKKLSDLTYRNKGIDLIFAVDMLNMGYHVDSLTGIIMYRGTMSNIIYVQELGRVLSTGTDKQAIVFDVVDNLHNHAIYEMLGRESLYTKNAKERLAALEKKAEKWEKFVRKCQITASPNNLAQTVAKKKRLEQQLEALSAVNTPQPILQSIKASLDNIRPAAEEAESKLNEIREMAKEHFKDEDLFKLEFTQKDSSELNSLLRRFDRNYEPRQNVIRKEDLIVKDEVATYKELIRKLVAEAKAHRINEAWENYLECGGIYRDENGNLLTSKKQFLALQPPENIPLEPFCSLRRVTVDEVLDRILEGDDLPELKKLQAAGSRVVVEKKKEVKKEAVS